MPCDAIFDTAASAGLAPLKEERALLPGNNRRPADILLRHWCGGKDAALDVTITHPLKSDTRAGAALTPGHAASVTFENKMLVLQNSAEQMVWLLYQLSLNPWGLPSCCYRAAEEDCFCPGPSHRPRGVRGYPPYCFSFNNSLFPSPTVLARNVLRQQGRGIGGAISVLSTPKTWCDLRAIHTKSWCE